jgi:hypothetical protein
MSEPRHSPSATTNSVFLRELAQAAPNGTTLWTAAFVGNPDLAGGSWAGQPFNPALHAAVVDGWGGLNTYFSVAALRPDGNGEMARRKDNFARLLVLVADDVQADDLVGRPSYVLNTSPGKCQVGVLLDRDDPACADQQAVSRVLVAMAASGQIKADKSGNNAVRYVRLPVGQNQKPRPGGAFQVSLQLFDPAVRYSLADAAAVFGIDVDLLQPAEVEQSAQSVAGRPQDALVRELTGNILAGRNLHDSLNMLAASLVATGMGGGAVVNMLRGLMDSSAAQRDDRFKARMADIPRAVSTAQQKFAPAVTISLLQRQQSAVDILPAAQDEDAPPAAISVPAHLMTVPGMLGLAVGWINATARKPQPLFAVQTALAAGSALMGRKYRTNNSNWPALYFLNVGQSGAGKEHAKHAVERLLEAAGLQSLIGAGRFASESGVVSSLIEKPAQFSVSGQ